MTQPALPAVAERFLRYVQIDTQSDPRSDTVPSTEKQKDLSRLLTEELRQLGLENAGMDEHGYVYAHLPAIEANSAPTIAFVAHVDTSPEEPGGPVRPMIHRAYDGSVLTLSGDPTVTLDPARSPGLLSHLGHDLITGDGTTLLGSDDKAGVALIMQLADDLLAEPGPRPRLAICFTVDEEIGRGVDHLDLERLGAEVAYTVDGGEVGTLDTETFHAAEAVIEVDGVSVHPGTAKGVMANAAGILAEIFAALPEAERPETTEGREGYFCPVDLQGSIPAAQGRMILRDFDSEGLELRKELVRRLVELARVKHPRSTIRLAIHDQYKNMKDYIAAKDPRAVTLALRAAETMGIELEQTSVRGGTDGSRLSELGLPTPNIFTGGHDYHSRFEWNSVQNLETSLAYLKHLVAAWAE